MLHDMLAELAGYRNELDIVKGKDKPEREKAIRTEIDRVTAACEARAAELDAAAASLQSAGQDVKAAELTVEARRYRAALVAPPGAENTADATPTEKAVTSRRAKE